MKNTLLFLFSILSLSLVAQENKISECIEKSIVSINANDIHQIDESNLKFLKEKIKDSEIVILGESGHGDGSAFVAKTRLIKFLVKEMGFNTLAFEAANMLEMYQAQLKINENNDVFNEISNSWANIWSQSKQTQELIEYIGETKNHLNLFGIDPQFSGTNYSMSSVKIIKDLSKESLNGIDLQSFQMNTLSLYMIFIGDTNYMASLNKELFYNQLKHIRTNIEDSEVYADKLIVQWTYNMEDFTKYLFLHKGNRKDADDAIQLRDDRMAKNVIWYKENHPDSKIIIWTANFHGCLDIEYTKYKPDDNWYQYFIPMGEQLKKYFGNNLYSIAMTSFEGETQVIFQQSEPDIIKSSDESIESYINNNIKSNFSYVDFRQISKSESCSNTKFKSNILGLKEGKWFKMFDGLFYIKTMEKSEPIE